VDLKKRVRKLEDTIEEGFSSLSAEIVALRTLIVQLSESQSTCLLLLSSGEILF
jgi:hypothetical protein